MRNARGLTAEGMYREGRVMFGAKMAYAQQEFEHRIQNENFEGIDAENSNPDREEVTEDANKDQDSQHILF